MSLLRMVDYRLMSTGRKPDDKYFYRLCGRKLKDGRIDPKLFSKDILAKIEKECENMEDPYLFGQGFFDKKHSQILDDKKPILGSKYSDHCKGGFIDKIDPDKEEANHESKLGYFSLGKKNSNKRGMFNSNTSAEQQSLFSENAKANSPGDNRPSFSDINNSSTEKNALPNNGDKCISSDTGPGIKADDNSVNRGTFIGNNFNNDGNNSGSNFFKSNDGGNSASSRIPDNASSTVSTFFHNGNHDSSSGGNAFFGKPTPKNGSNHGSAFVGVSSSEDGNPIDGGFFRKSSPKHDASNGRAFFSQSKSSSSAAKINASNGSTFFSQSSSRAKKDSNNSGTGFLHWSRSNNNANTASAFFNQSSPSHDNHKTTGGAIGGSGRGFLVRANNNGEGSAGNSSNNRGGDGFFNPTSIAPVPALFHNGNSQVRSSSNDNVPMMIQGTFGPAPDPARRNVSASQMTPFIFYFQGTLKPGANNIVINF